MRASWSIAIFVAVFSLYLISSSREPAWGDAHSMFEVAERLVKDGAIDIHTRWPEDLPAGRDGKTYGIAPIGPSLAHVPGAALGALSHAVAPSQDGLIKPIAVHVGPAVLGALACLVFFGLLRDLGARTRVASLCTAMFACATTLWVYARYPYSEILQLVCFLGMFRAALRVCADPKRREAIWLGIWAGCLLNSKYVFALAIVGAAALVAWTHRRQALRPLAWAAAAGAPLVILALAYNYLRWGSITQTGYEPYLSAYFGGSVFDGAWGMLASPNKSALLYSPPLVLALFGWPALIRSHRRVGLALAAIALPTFLVYCTYRSWSGDYAWGPRFFVWATPVVLLGIAGFCAELTRWKKAALVAVMTVGVVVQLLGSALYWDHFIRLAIDTKNQWLGNPNRSGAYIAEAGRGHCDSCFEDTYELLWTPAFQPIRGHWWLVKSLARGDDWQSAQADAPWRTYTSLQVNLSADFGRARIDWWALNITDRTEILGIVLILLFAGGLGWGVFTWIRLHRAADP